MRDPHAVDDLIRKSTEVEIPADVEGRMRRQLAEFRLRLGRERHPAREWAARLLGQRPLRWAAAGVALGTVVAIVIAWGGGDGGRTYAATVSRLAAARSVQYTMELAPFVSVEFSHLAPAHERISMSWGIEIRADGSGAQLVLLHGTKQYVREQKGPDSLIRTADLIDQLTSLPPRADARLGERTVGGKRFVGYRVLGARMPRQHGVDSLDLWLDAESGLLDHVDITPTGAGASGYQMHVRDIRVDADVDPALFDMTPPAGYADARSAAAAERSQLASSQPQITTATQQSAIVIRMSGSYAQAAAAIARVAQHLQERGVVALGPAFGRFESESHWEVGYPVPRGTRTDPPFEMVTLPGGLVASVVVNGAWGQDSAARWSRLLSWTGAQGYIVVGPPTEVWSGDKARPDGQVTEMRIPVVRGRH